MTFTKFLRTLFLENTLGWLFLIFRKIDIQTFDSKEIYSFDQCCRHAIFDEYS